MKNWKESGAPEKTPRESTPFVTTFAIAESQYFPVPVSHRNKKNNCKR
jgi:hypothetical protein